MKLSHLIALAGGMMFSASAVAQPLASGLVMQDDRQIQMIDGVPVNMAKFPEFRNRNFAPEPLAADFVTRYRAAKLEGREGAAATGRPDHLNNAATRYFPPVFNQSSGSCGAASRIAYMFTHEQNAYRDLDATLPENQYPTHFVFLLTYGNSGKDEFVTNVGIPSVKAYGGRTYSNLFGYNEWDDEDYGWMTGYDKWFEAFHNRCTSPTSNPYSLGTEEGREFAKNWLWNHCGDLSFHAGGLIGLGVASGGVWRDIPKTDANDAAGVSGMGYVKEWGVSVDHALTLVGYDDRVEFDLDGDGIYGEEETSKQIGEKGAWIIVNSWGSGWENGGFIYCPYSFAGATFNNDGNAGSRTFNKNSWWYGELYHVRKDYRPFRTIKLKMDYTHRSELLLQAGVSADLNADEPQSIISMDHFKYAGDGHNGDLDPAPAVPMLGKWADGKMHNEPMEFGYDLTDLSSGFDRNQPLKYFFIVTRKKATSLGSGHIYEASIMDYENDLDGIETPFDLGETGEYEITQKGNKTVISVVVYGAGYNAPNSLAYSDGMLSWAEPDRSSHSVASYNIYKEGVLVDNTADTSWDISKAYADLNGDGQITADDAPLNSESYSVSAVYEDGKESSKQTICTPVPLPEKNQVYLFSKAGFTIPDVFNGAYSQATIEFWFKPTSFSNWNNTAGPGWGTWYQHCDAQGHYYCGWNTDARVISNTVLEKSTWYYISIVVNGGRCTLYINGKEDGSITSNTYSGIGGFGNLVFNSSDASKYQQARYDEIRIWNYARSAAQIKALYSATAPAEFYGDVMPEGLVAYYKGDSFQDATDSWYMRDCIGGHHALTSLAKTPSSGSTTPGFVGATGEGTLEIEAPAQIYAGLPTTFSAKYSDNVNHLQWTAPFNTTAQAPTYVFPKAGEYEVTLTGRDYSGNELNATRTLTVLDAPAIDASFVATKTNVAAGERISFKPTTVVNGYAYKWSFPGAQVEEVNSMSAGANYEQFGTYTVTLTVTDANGQSASTSQTVTVEQVAPVAAFNISESVVKKGHKVALVDESKFAPNKWQWQLTCATGSTIINGQNTLYEATAPGVYDVRLTVSNEAGRNSFVQERALTVVNADSKNGLSFAQGARVKPQQQPVAAGQRQYTFEWWMKPAKLTSYCQGIGESDATFQIKSDAKGKLYLSNKGKTAASNDGTVIEGQWHHYAVTVSGTAVTFYRDGVKSGTGTVSSQFADLGAFTIGTSAADWNGSIDEFRVWNKVLTLDEIRAVNNQPLPADVSTLSPNLTNDLLLLYYDFNQVGSEVKDLAQTMNNGARSGFGPDGDAWDLSKGVFSLNYDANAVEDFTSKVLTNYKRSFKYDSKTTVNNSTASRFYAINDWILENQTIEGNVTTGVHVDKQKSNDFTCTTGWDGFGNLTNHKAYQVFDIEPGLYTLTVSFGDHGAAGQSYLVAALGDKLPDASELEEKALSYANLSDGTMTFIVPEIQRIALGVLVGSMKDKSIFTIREFKLTRAELDVREAMSIDGIEEVTTAPAAGETIYDLYGRRVVKPQDGQIYIQNGKAVIR